MSDRPSKKPGRAAAAEALLEEWPVENLDALKASLDGTTKSSNESMDAKIDALSQQVATMKGDITTAKSEVTRAMEKRAASKEGKLDKLTDLEGKLEASTEQVASQQYALEAERASSALKLSEVEGKLKKATKSNALLASQVIYLESQNDKREAALSDARSAISSLREFISRLSENVAGLTVSPPRVLTTTFASGAWYKANVFKVQAVRDLFITGFSIHTLGTSPSTVDVWERAGDYSGFENNKEWWTLAQSTAVAGLGKGSRAELADLPVPLPIAAGATHSFHIWCSHGVWSTSGSREGSTLSQNAGELIFFEGRAGDGFSCLWAPVVANIDIRYKLVVATAPGATS